MVQHMPEPGAGQGQEPGGHDRAEQAADPAAAPRLDEEERRQQNSQNNGGSDFGAVLGGMIIGSLLSGGVSLFRRRMSPTVFTWIDLISGGVIAAFGIALVGAAAWRML